MDDNFKDGFFVAVWVVLIFGVGFAGGAWMMDSRMSEALKLPNKSALVLARECTCTCGPPPPVAGSLTIPNGFGLPLETR